MRAEDTTETGVVATAKCDATVLAVDLGKFKSVACVLDASDGSHRFETIATTPSAVHDLLVATSPRALVIEACSVCGWVPELATTS